MAKEPSEPFEERYWRRLGAFIHQFTIMEVQFFRLLCAVAKIEIGIGRALFNGTRLDGLINNIRRCHEALEMEVSPVLEGALVQAAILNGARNDAIHLLAKEWPEEGDDHTALLLTNSHRYMPGKAKTVPLSPRNLEAMWLDAQQINLIAWMMTSERLEPGSTKEFKDEWAALYAPWLYKSPEQSSSRRKPRARRQKREPPPESSAG